jgi:AcrR family transcriptional regulator
MSSATKSKILDAAIALFNERGYMHVRLREIAAEVGISAGNLAYHFPQKDDLMSAAYERMVEELRLMIADIRMIPSFENIDRQMRPFVLYQQKYQFFYLDLLELCRSFPGLADVVQHTADRQIESIRGVIDYAVGSSNMITEPGPGSYDRLARTCWMILSFWLAQKQLRGLNASDSDMDEEGPQASIWSMLIPYLTDKGRHNLKDIASRYNLVLEASTQTPQNSDS